MHDHFSRRRFLAASCSGTPAAKQRFMLTSIILSADSTTPQASHPDLPKKCFRMNFSCASGGGLLPPW